MLSAVITYSLMPNYKGGGKVQSFEFFIPHFMTFMLLYLCMPVPKKAKNLYFPRDFLQNQTNSTFL